jgi:hypothetical protein
MKKIISSVAMILGSFTTYAATIDPTLLEVHLNIQDKSAKINFEELLDTVLKAAKESYPDAVINKVYINMGNQYKHTLTVKDQNATVFADADGNWIKK